MNTVDTFAIVAPSASSVREYSAKKVLLAALAGGATAGVINLGLFLVARAAGVPFTAKFDPHAVVTMLPAQATFFASVVPAFAAAAVLSLLNVLVKRPTTIFVGIAATFGLLSMGGPASLAEAAVSTKALLAVMHVVAGVAIVGAVVKRGKR